MEARSRKSQGTMEGLRERPKTRGKSIGFARQAPESMQRGPPGLSERRESIIDPASVRVSYTGEVSDIGQPARPLEQGLQALYDLYEDNVVPPTPLPKSVQITEVPLFDIAISLADLFRERNEALTDCAEALTNQNLQLDRQKDEIVALEGQYSIALENASLHSLTYDELHARLRWQKAEIERLNHDKEKLIRETEDAKDRNEKLTGKLDEMTAMRQENAALRQVQQTSDEIQQALVRELRDAKGKLEVVQKVNVRNRVRMLLAELRGEKEPPGLLIPGSPPRPDRFF